MAKRKGGLGRGLAELLGEGTAKAAYQLPCSGQVDPQPAGVIDLPVSSIRPNPRQPRRTIDSEGLEELARSIEAVGVVQPVIVRRRNDGYELIAGERRYLAAQIAGFTAIPAIVREASDVESLELALVENVVREQLNPLDEAYAFQVLLEDLGVTQEALAARVGKSRPAIANKIRLLELPAAVQSLLRSGELSEGHGRALLGLSERSEQMRLARRAVKRGLSVRAVEEAVRRAEGRVQADGDGIRQAGLPEDLLDEARDRFYGLVGVLPRIRMGARGGLVEVPFRDAAELRHILDKMGERM